MKTLLKLSLLMFVVVGCGSSNNKTAPPPTPPGGAGCSGGGTAWDPNVVSQLVQACQQQSMSQSGYYGYTAVGNPSAAGSVCGCYAQQLQACYSFQYISSNWQSQTSQSQFTNFMNSCSGSAAGSQYGSQYGSPYGNQYGNQYGSQYGSQGGYY